MNTLLSTLFPSDRLRPLEKPLKTLGGGVALIGLSLLAQGQAFAGTMVQPVTITSQFGTSNPLSPLTNIINQSGLSTTYNSATDFDSYTATTTHTSVFNTIGSSATVQSPQYYTFDLGAEATIDAMALWAAQTEGLATVSADVADFELYAGSDDTGTLLGTYQAPFKSSSLATVLSNVFSFNSTKTQYITLKALNVWRNVADPNDTNPHIPYIGEVAFRQGETPQSTPEPSALLGLGLFGLGALVSRKRKG